MEKKDITWEDYEYEHRPKDTPWFLGVFVVGAAVIIAAILLQSVLFALFALVSLFAFIVLGARTPRKIPYSITRRGVRIGNTMYPYHAIESFWVRTEDDPYNTLVLKPERAFATHVVIPLANVSPEEVRDYLLDHVDEEVHEKSLVEAISELIGF